MPIRYALAIGIFLAALALRFTLFPVEYGLAYSTFYASAIICFYVCGIGPGALTVVLSAAVAFYIFVPPFWSFSPTPQRLASLAVFLLTNTVAGTVVHALHRYNRRQRDTVLELREAHRQLLATKQQYLDVLETQSESISRYTPDGTLVFVNGAFSKWFDLPPGELIGKNWEPFALQEDIALVKAQLAALSPTNPVVTIENRVVLRGGNIRWGEFVNRGIFDESGHLSEIQSVGRDITESKDSRDRLAASEQRLQTIIDNVPAFIAYWNMDWRCEFCNRTFADAYGIRPDEARGKPAAVIFGNDTYALLLPHLEAAYRGDKITNHRTFVDAEGALRNVETTFIPDFGNGVQRGMFIFTTDVTSLTRQVEERTRELSAAKDAAEAANRVKDEIIANVSHEMRTPLHSIISFAKLGHARLSPENIEKPRTYFERIGVSGVRLDQFIGNLLELARIGSGEVKPHLSATDLTALVKNVIEDLQPLLDAKGLSTPVIANTLSAVAMVDRDMFERVLLNIISNAIKFSPDGGTICVEISDCTLGSEGNESFPALRTAISDDGPGIPVAELETIFAPFKQSSRTDKKVGGTGLGLTISRNIVEMHGGVIRACNNAGGGANFELIIPRYTTIPLAQVAPIVAAHPTDVGQTAPPMGRAARLSQFRSDGPF